jgi:hypothetical protein
MFPTSEADIRLSAKKKKNAANSSVPEAEEQRGRHSVRGKSHFP